MGTATWEIKNNKLFMYLNWRQQNETSDGSSGQGCQFSEPLIGNLSEVAEQIFESAKEYNYNLSAFNGLNDWKLLEQPDGR